ncbi:MAG TPA: hypothetical protein VL175_07870 [Pirellulales bacterium]|jgi:hypothetical protein|nr:hypothetical protein [Pirellulales bacterium]
MSRCRLPPPHASFIMPKKPREVRPRADLLRRMAAVHWQILEIKKRPYMQQEPEASRLSRTLKKLESEFLH